MLFGVGLAIQAETLARRGSVPRLLTRRLLVLLAFGLVHMFLLFNGDILTEYALAGLIALPFVLLPPKITLSAAAAALMLFLSLSALPVSLPFPNSEWMAQHVIEARRAYGQGSFTDVFRFRIAEVQSIGVYLAFIFARTISLILFGAWAWKSGLIGERGPPAKLHRTVGWLGLVVGLLLSWLDGAGLAAPLVLPPVVAHIIDLFAPIALAVSYSALALGYLANSSNIVVAWAAPVGRMAFTNYIAQSLLLGLLFYGYGFGLMGRIGVVAGVAISVTIFLGQMIFSRWWLRHHNYGPLEWLWRTGMYGTPQPWRKTVGDPPWGRART